MNVILLSVLSIAITAFVCAVLLVIASKVFAVEEAPLFPAIRECLPGANCGACGYAGCDGYARALASGEESRTNLCVPGASTSAAAIAAVMGTEAAAPVEARMALVFCGGECGKALTAGDGSKACAYGCLGCGDCAAVCPVQAISLRNGVAVVNPELCIGCGKCEKTCPRKVIRLVSRKQKAFDRCANPEMGKGVLSVCKAGCIGCAKCSRLCPMDAITMEGNLALVDADKCVGCGNCEDNCPTHSMTLL